jgi:lipopolysaccharide export system protein LptA
MNVSSYLKYAILILLIGLVLIIAINFRKDNGQGMQKIIQVDGQGMHSFRFNDKNEKILEIRSTEIESVEKDKTFLKNIEATLFQKGEKNKDLLVKGEKGFIENNDYNFHIEGNARIISEDVSFSSDQFTLIDRNILRSKSPTQFTIKKEVAGSAEKGMVYNIKKNNIDLKKPKGTFTKNNQIYQFETKLLQLFRADSKLRFNRHCHIQGNTMDLKSDWLTVFFDDDLKNILSMLARGNCFFKLFSKIPGEKKEKLIQAHFLQNHYGQTGKLEKTRIEKIIDITLIEDDSLLRIYGNSVELLYTETESIHQALITENGRIDNEGKNPFRITGDHLNVTFNEKNEIGTLTGNGNCQYKSPEYQAKAQVLNYRADVNEILLSGADSLVVADNQQFMAAGFHINTKARIIKSAIDDSKEGNQEKLSLVKSTLKIQMKNLIFSDAPVYINADEFSLAEKSNQLIYRNNVRLRQQDSVLTADQLEIKDKNSIFIQGNAVFTFLENNKKLTIEGSQMTLMAANRQLSVNENARLNSVNQIKPESKNDQEKKAQNESLEADSFLFKFDNAGNIDVIEIINNVRFQQDDLSATSGKAEWFFQKEQIIFTDHPQVSRSNQSATKGKKLLLDLKQNKLTVLSEEKRAETTVQNQ